MSLDLYNPVFRMFCCKGINNETENKVVMEIVKIWDELADVELLEEGKGKVR